jgi:hypothetical protein
MADSNLKKRAPLREAVIIEDDTAIEGLKTIPDYDPRNTDVTTAKITAKQALRDAARTEVQNLELLLAAAQDKSAALEHEVHDDVVVMREQVVAQYGKSSDQAVAVGLKKKSEYKH